MWEDWVVLSAQGGAYTLKKVPNVKILNRISIRLRRIEIASG